MMERRLSKGGGRGVRPLHFFSNYKINYLISFAVHVGSVRQTASILTMSQEHLRTGDKALCRFRFIKNPEYMRTDMRMVFREGRTKAVGNITKLFPHVSAVAQNTRQQRAAKKAQEANHQLKPQNEPQKPSKKNQKPRSRHGGHGGLDDPTKDKALHLAAEAGAAAAAAPAQTTPLGAGSSAPPGEP